MIFYMGYMGIMGIMGKMGIMGNNNIEFSIFRENTK